MATLTGTSASERITGSTGDDTLIGLGGNDELRGLEGNDTYLFEGQFDNDTITYDRSGIDRVVFGAGYTQNNFRMVRTSRYSYDLTIQQISSNQSVTLEGFFHPNQQNNNFIANIETVVFQSTGTTWNLGSGEAFSTIGFVGTAASETLAGSSGNDRFTGLAGNDTLTGLEGNDTYVFAGAFGQDTIASDTAGVDLAWLSGYAEWEFGFTRSGSDLVLQQAGGNNSIRFDNYYTDPGNRVETVVFDKTGTVYNLASGQPVLQQAGYFDRDAYLAANADVRNAGIDPYTHYMTSGWREGRDPSARFDTQAYLRNNPDIAAAGINPLAHYLSSGQFEGRTAAPAVGRQVINGFDAEYYLLSNPDVGLAGIDPAAHYAASGWREGRNPSAYFDSAYYLQQNRDVAAAGINPLDHFNGSGWREGRNPSANFSLSGYQAANPDVAAAGINPLSHYLVTGRSEGRSLGILASGA